MTLRRLIGIALGLIGLGLAVLGYALDLAPVAAGAGLFAAAAGFAALVAEQRSETDDRRFEDLLTELRAARDQLERARGELEQTQRTVDATRTTVAELIATRASDEVAATAPHDPSDTRLLADPETNLFSEAYFRVALDARIASARRHLRPVAIALLQVVEGQGDGNSHAADPLKVTGSIRQTLRDADTACRMSDGSFALILEDTPENGAVWTVERIRRNLTSRHGLHTMWAGVACYPAHAFSTDELLDQTTLALASAREWKQDRIEIATAD